MASRVEISAKIPAIAEICARYGVRELALFGSGLGPDFGPDSDLDFLVGFLPCAQVGLVRLGQLQRELESLLQRKADLVPKHGLKPPIRDRVLQHTEPVYAGSPAVHEEHSGRRARTISNPEAMQLIR